MLWILFVSIIFGNCSVLITLVFSKGRGSRFRYFIKHLAIADLSVGLVSVLTDIIWKFTIEWKAGNIICKVVKYSQVSSSAPSCKSNTLQQFPVQRKAIHCQKIPVKLNYEHRLILFLLVFADPAELFPSPYNVNINVRFDIMIVRCIALTYLINLPSFKPHDNKLAH